MRAPCYRRSRRYGPSNPHPHPHPNPNPDPTPNPDPNPTPKQAIWAFQRAVGPKLAGLGEVCHLLASRLEP